jgi:hypothetical protein
MLQAPFCEPVNWKEMGLLDYPALIKKPMDLGTIRVRFVFTSSLYFLIATGQDKALAGGYKTAEEIAADIRLVWTNCMTYNEVNDLSIFPLF